MMSVLQKAKSAVAAVLVREPQGKQAKPLDFDKATAAAVDASKSVAAKRAKIRECENEVAAADRQVQAARKLLAACKEVDPRIERLKTQLDYLREHPARLAALFADAEAAIEAGDAGRIESLRDAIVREQHDRPQFVYGELDSRSERAILSRNVSKAAGLRSEWTDRLEKEKAGLQSVRANAAADILRQQADSLNARERRIREQNPGDKAYQLAQLERDRESLNERYAVFRAVTGQQLTWKPTGF